MTHLVASHLRKEFPTRSEPLVVLCDVSLQLRGGESAAILGPSGSGKSTLLHILGTLDEPTSGSVQLDEADPFSMDEPSLARFRNEKIGFIFQQHHLLPQLTILENVLIPALAHGAVNSETDQRARELLERVGLADRQQHRPAEISGGEQQRVAVARALLNRPSLILADEPTGNLDRNNALRMAQLLSEIQSDPDQRTVLVVVTHSEEIAGYFDQQLVLDNGSLRHEFIASGENETD